MTCPIDECPRLVKGDLLMCAGHWAMVPWGIRSEVYRTWRARLVAMEEAGPVHAAARLAHEAAKAKAIAAVNGLLARGAAKAGQRHSWERSQVQVPWSSVPENLYTCRKCGCTRKSEPIDAGGLRFRVAFGVPNASGERTYSYGRTPPCVPLQTQAKES